MDNVVESLLLAARATQPCRMKMWIPTTADTLTVQDTAPANVIFFTDVTDGGARGGSPSTNISFYSISMWVIRTAGNIHALRSFSSVSMWFRAAPILLETVVSMPDQHW